MMEESLGTSFVSALTTGGPVAVVMAFVWWRAEQRANSIFEKFIVLTEKYATSAEMTAEALKRLDDKLDRRAV